MHEPIYPPSGTSPGFRDLLVSCFRKHDWRGWTRVYNFLKPHGGRREIRFQTRFGSQFFLVPWDEVDSHALSEGFYESEVLEAVRPCLQADAVIWFVGANFGLHAITAKLLEPRAHIICFEPNPRMASRLLENAELNCVKVELLPCALGDRCALQKFYINASGNPGMSTLFPMALDLYDETFFVPVETAERLIDETIVLRPHAVVIDAEGAELPILKGFGSKLLEPTMTRVIFEAENELLENPHSSEIIRLLENAGLSQIEKLIRNENTAHSLSNFVAKRA